MLSWPTFLLGMSQETFWNTAALLGIRNRDMADFGLEAYTDWVIRRQANGLVYWGLHYPESLSSSLITEFCLFSCNFLHLFSFLLCWVGEKSLLKNSLPNILTPPLPGEHVRSYPPWAIILRSQHGFFSLLPSLQCTPVLMNIFVEWVKDEWTSQNC